MGTDGVPIAWSGDAQLGSRGHFRQPLADAPHSLPPIEDGAKLGIASANVSGGRMLTQTMVCGSGVERVNLQSFEQTSPASTPHIQPAGGQIRPQSTCSSRSSGLSSAANSPPGPADLDRMASVGASGRSDVNSLNLPTISDGTVKDGTFPLRQQVEDLKTQLREQNRCCADLREELAAAINKTKRDGEQLSNELAAERSAHAKTKAAAAEAAQAARRQLEAAMSEAADEQMAMYNLLEAEKDLHGQTRKKMKNAVAASESLNAVTDSSRQELREFRKLYDHEKSMADNERAAAASASAQLQQERAAWTSQRWEMEKAADRAAAEIASLNDALATAQADQKQVEQVLHSIRGEVWTASKRAEVAEGERDVARREADEAQKTSEEWIAELQAERRRKETSIADLHAKTEYAVVRETNLLEQHKNEAEKHRVAAAALELSRSEVVSLQSDLCTEQNKRAAAQQQGEAAAAELVRLQCQVAEFESMLSTANKRVAWEREQGDGARAETALMEASWTLERVCFEVLVMEERRLREQAASAVAIANCDAASIRQTSVVFEANLTVQTVLNAVDQAILSEKLQLAAAERDEAVAKASASVARAEQSEIDELMHAQSEIEHWKRLVSELEAQLVLVDEQRKISIAQYERDLQILKAENAECMQKVSDAVTVAPTQQEQAETTEPEPTTEPTPRAWKEPSGTPEQLCDRLGEEATALFEAAERLSRLIDVIELLPAASGSAELLQAAERLVSGVRRASEPPVQMVSVAVETRDMNEEDARASAALERHAAEEAAAKLKRMEMIELARQKAEEATANAAREARQRAARAAEDKERDEEWAMHSTALLVGGQGCGMKDIRTVLMLTWPPVVATNTKIDATTTSWQELPGAELPFNRRHFSVSSLYGGSGFAIAGGCVEDEDSSELDLFDSVGLGNKVKNTKHLLRKAGAKQQPGWTSAAKMPRSRRGATMIELPDGRLAVIGGGVYPAGRQQNHPVLTLVNTFDPATGRWRTLPALEHARENFGGCCVSDRLRPAAAVAVNNGESDMSEATEDHAGWWRIVVCGGIGVVGGDSHLSSVEAYGSGMQSWEQLPEMPQRAEGCGCTALPGRRFACAGGRGVKGAAIYSFSSGSWTKLPPMSVARMLPGVAYARGYVIVAGGTGDKMEVFASVEAIPCSADEDSTSHVAKSRWRELATLPEPRRWCNMVSVHFAAPDLAAMRSKKIGTKAGRLR